MHLPGPLRRAILGLVCGAAALHGAQAVVVQVDRPPALDRPDAWPVITAEQRLATSGGESARWIACYDADALYVLMWVRDESPLKNSASAFDPAMALKGGDAVGFCFGPAVGGGQRQRILVAQLDGKPMAVCYRPTSPVKKPYSFASPVSTYVMDYVAPLPEVRAAFSTIDSGYALGVAIPWRVLGYKPAGGLEFPFDAQVIFSDPAGTKNIATAWWHSRGNGPACTVDLPTEAHLYDDLWGSARLFTADPGPQADDEVDHEEGIVSDPEGLQPVPITFTLPRACKASLVIADASGWIVAEPLRAAALAAGSHTILWNGRGYRDMPLPAGSYTWRLAYFDGVRSLFLAAAGNSGRPPYPSADKKGSIGGVHLGPAAVAADAGGVYLLHAGEEGEHGLRKVDAAGSVLWTHSIGNFGNATAVASDGAHAFMCAGFPELSLVCMDAATGRDVAMGKAGARIALGDPKRDFAGLAIVGGKAYVSIATEDRLLVIDVGTGQALPDLALPRPRRLCRQDDTHLLAISGDQVVRIDLTARAITPLVSGLVSPTGLALARDGVLFVAESGAKQQIARFARDGHRLAALGKPGGRALTVPVYDPLEFRNIVDLAFDAQGQAWFVEGNSTAPRRIGCLSAEGGWIRDYCGPVYCSSGMVVDLDDPTAVYYHIGPSWMKTRLGLSTAHAAQDFTWKIDSIHYLSQSGTEVPAVPDLMLPSSNPSFAEGITFIGSNGKRYFWIDGESTYTRNQPAALWVWSAGRWVPAGIQAQQGKPCWIDRNGDGLVQPDENTTLAPDGSWRWLDRGLTLYGSTGSWQPARIDERGVPDYEGGTFTPYATQPTVAAWLKEVSGTRPTAVSRPGPDGSVYYVANIGNAQGRAFWDRASETKLIKLKDGKVQWWAGHHDATNRTTGDSTYLYNVCGIEDGVVVVSDVANQYIAYTDDGLTLGWLLTDANGRPRWSDDSYVSAESFSGQFIKDPKSGKYLLFCGASESCQVREVMGIAPDQIARLEGRITLVSSLPRTAPSPRATVIPYGTWECSNGRANGVDGDDWEWWPRSYDALTIRDGKQVVADVRLRRDAGYLQVFADVLQADAFHPAAEKAGASGGDGVELLLGPMLPAERTAPVAGDTCVFLTARRGERGQLQGLAFACRPANPPAPLDPSLRQATTWGTLKGAAPTGSGDFSKGLQPIPGAQVAIRPRPDGKGFRLEAELPLGLFPEIATARPLAFKRWTNSSNHAITTYKEERYDLTGPLRLNAAVFTTGADGARRRLPWLAGSPAVDSQAVTPTEMNPSTWGVANAVITARWPRQPGATSYRLYRAPTADAAAARLVQTIDTGTVASDFPGPGTFHYWLTVIDSLGESQLLGPQAITVGGPAAAEPRIEFSGQPAPALLFPNLPDLALLPGSSQVLHVTMAAKSLVPVITPAGATATCEALGDGHWRLVVAMPQAAKPGDRFRLTLTASGSGKPVAATCTVTAVPLAVVGQRTQTGGVLVIDTSAPVGQTLTNITWPGRGSLASFLVGRAGYVLVRRNARDERVPRRDVRAPFLDTFAGDGFWYGEDGGNMQFDLAQPDGSVQQGRDAQGRCYFGAVNGNAGTAGKPDTFPKAGWTIEVSDAAPHLLTVFSPARGGAGAKERFTLSSATGDFPPASVEFSGGQGGSIVQFRFIGKAALTVQQTAGGPGASPTPANCAAIFLD